MYQLPTKMLLPSLAHSVISFASNKNWVVTFHHCQTNMEKKILFSGCWKFTCKWCKYRKTNISLTMWTTASHLPRKEGSGGCSGEQHMKDQYRFTWWKWHCTLVYYLLCIDTIGSITKDIKTMCPSTPCAQNTLSKREIVLHKKNCHNKIHHRFARYVQKRGEGSDLIWFVGPKLCMTPAGIRN